MKTALLSTCVLFVACSGGGPAPDAGMGPDTFALAVSFAAGTSSEVTAIAADSTGIVLVGQITGTATFGTTTLTATSTEGNPFVAKLDPTGIPLWAKIASGSPGLFEAVVLDASSNIYVSGAEDGTGASSGITLGGTMLAGAGGPLFKLTPSGTVSWGKLEQASDPMDSGALTLSGTNVVVAGVLSGDAMFDGMTIPTCPNTGCVFLAAYDQTTGAIEWFKQAASTPMRGEGAAHPREVWVAADSTGSLVVAIGGFFESSLQTDANQLVVNKYDATGTLVWSKAFAQPMGRGPTVSGLAVDSTDAIIVGGGFGDGLQFGAQPVIPNSPSNDSDYVAKLSSGGDVVWAVSQAASAPTFNITALGLGAQIYTFGNGNDPDDILPSGALPMNLGAFDPSTGAEGPTVVCGPASPGRAEALSVSSAGVFVTGEGGHPGAFGTKTLTADGLFVAKLK